MSDIKQKEKNYKKALETLKESLVAPIEEYRDIAGIIKGFEIVYELSWRLLKIRLENSGLEVYGPKDIFKKAYQNNFIADEETWLDMLKDRNETVHTYNEEFAREMLGRIRNDFVPVYEKLLSFK